MEVQEIKAVMEGLLFVSGDEGMEAKELAHILELEEEMVIDLIYDLQADFDREGRGLQIVQLAHTFQLTTRPDHYPYFKKLAESPHTSTLSQAALETLAIVAYRQPITRPEIEEIRGVKSERAIQTLVAKELIEEVGRQEGSGRPILYGTSRQFLDYFGLSRLEDLPPLPETILDDERFEEEKARLLQMLDDDSASTSS
ncbi:SMC-Scp complex subunit ScpB [Rubeoparvulum massiliense]|uniref:SMC-Scp complex subunit ScpB n=1 Tax=Rubeoparvulum massiliense TaxID=1631346 RepID=UPI00065DE38C|nr:SMC-Scp complex subunit ScpB [Rubeoparvulum massiliense]